ncbi:MAG TPA: PAS domain-containing protein [Deltaproteobacteria bacterium]|nr:PAS domain-containing protein [Deltaproteobacteria bacterium]HPP80650.1 PAS domain-containing protein [Deltaproteobacteria bacterium]
MAAYENTGGSQERVLEFTERIARLEEEIRGLTRRSTFFELLIKSLPGLFYVFDQNYELHMWNKNVETVTGYLAEEIPVHSIFDIFEGEDLEHVQKAIQHAFITGSGVAEAVLVTKDGRKIPYFFTGVSTRIEDVQYLIGMGLDISTLKEAQESLKESEALYRIFAERMTEGVALIHENRILFVNDALSLILSYDSRGPPWEGTSWITWTGSSRSISGTCSSPSSGGTRPSGSSRRGGRPSRAR